MENLSFSDENKFKLEGPDEWGCYWHDIRTEPCIFTKRKMGADSVMIWSCFPIMERVQLDFKWTIGCKRLSKRLIEGKFAMGGEKGRGDVAVSERYRSGTQGASFSALLT